MRAATREPSRRGFYERRRRPVGSVQQSRASMQGFVPSATGTLTQRAKLHECDLYIRWDPPIASHQYPTSPSRRAKIDREVRALRPTAAPESADCCAALAGGRSPSALSKHGDQFSQTRRRGGETRLCKPLQRSVCPTAKLLSCRRAPGGRVCGGSPPCSARERARGVLLGPVRAAGDRGPGAPREGWGERWGAWRRRRYGRAGGLHVVERC